MPGRPIPARIPPAQCAVAWLNNGPSVHKLQHHTRGQGECSSGSLGMLAPSPRCIHACRPTQPSTAHSEGSCFALPPLQIKRMQIHKMFVNDPIMDTKVVKNLYTGTPS